MNIVPTRRFHPLLAASLACGLAGAQAQVPVAEFATQVVLGGIGFVGDYSADKCSTIKESLTQTGKATATGAVLGAAILGTTTAAITGSPGKAGTATVLGGVLGAAVMPPLVNSNPTASQVFSGRDLARQRDFELCQIAHQARAQAAPAWENFAAVADTRACIIDRDPTLVSDAELQNCVKHDPELVAQLKRFVRVAFNINMAACEAGEQVWIKYDRLMRQNLAANQSFIKSLPATCTGTNPRLPRAYAWAQP